MWQAMIFIGMLVTTGYYAIANEVAAPAAASAKSADLATSMAIYRNAVVAYLRAHPDFRGQAVPDGVLQEALPSWYVMPHGKSAQPLWANRVCEDGTVVVFADEATPVNITRDVVRISKRSVIAGESHGSKTYYAPAREQGRNSRQSRDSDDKHDKYEKYDEHDEHDKYDKHGEYDKHDERESSLNIALPECANVASGRPVWIASFR